MVQSSVTKKPTAAQLAAYVASTIPAGGGAGAVPTQFAYATAIPLTHLGGHMAAHTVAAPITFTAAASPVDGATCSLRLIANGTNTPNFAAFSKDGAGSWVNTAAAVNLLRFFRVAGTNYYSVTQADAAVIPPTFLPSDRADLFAWYRKGVGQTDSGGLTVWNDQEGSSHLNAIHGVKGTINGDGTVSWAHNGEIGVSFAVQATPFAFYIRARIDTRTGFANQRIFNTNAMDFSYEGDPAPGDEDRIMVLGAIPIPTPDASDVVGPWRSFVMTQTGTTQYLAVDAVTPPPFGAGAANLSQFWVAGNSASGEYGDLTVAEIIVFSGVEHDDTDVNEVLAYLASVIS
jgi:hypothetical protein